MSIDGTDLRATRRELESALSDALARGEADPAALKLSARLGAVTAEIGNRHEARRHFRLVASAGPAVLGASHPLVRQAEAYLGVATPTRGSAIRTDGREIEVARSARVSQARPPKSRPHGGAPQPRAAGRPLIWVVAASAVAAGTVATGSALWSRDREPSRPTASAPAAMAARHVTVEIANGVVTVRWQDPAAGRAPFIVSGGVAGAKADIRQQVDAGQTSIVINGLNASRDYCFTVAAVYSADQVAISDLVCTKH